MNRTGPIESSTLLPKTHRNSMLPPRCSSPPCMNMAVKTVSHVDARGSAQPRVATCSPGCVTS